MLTTKLKILFKNQIYEMFEKKKKERKMATICSKPCKKCLKPCVF